MSGVSVSEDELESRLRRRWESLNLPADDYKVREKRYVILDEDKIGILKSLDPQHAKRQEGTGFSSLDLDALVNNKITPSDVDSSTSSPNTLGLDIQANDNSYFTTMQIGTPPRPFRILIDSGSADFWVPGEDCPVQTCGNHQRLGPATSSSFADATASGAQQQFRVVYGSGEVDGECDRFTA